MANANTRYAFRTVKRDQKLMVDMEFYGAMMLRDTRNVARTFRRFGDQKNIVNVLAKWGVSDQEAGGTGIVTESWAESLIRWRIVDNTSMPTMITDNSKLPSGTILANKPFWLELQDNWVEVDGIWACEDDNYTLYTRSKRRGVGSGYEYELEYISNDSTATFDKKYLLSPGKYLNYIGNAKQELSSTSQPVKMQSAFYDLFNVTQVIRHELGASGHALSTKVSNPNAMELFGEVDANGVFSPKGYLPFSGEMLRQHINYIGHTLYYGRTNFDPVSRKVLTLRSGGQRNEIPMTSGVKEQFQQTSYRGEYNPFDLASTNMRLIDSIIAARSEYFMKENVELVIFTEMGGAMVLQDIMMEKARTVGEVRINLDANTRTLSNVGLDLKGTTYTTPQGTFTIVNTGYTKDRGWVGEKVGWKGGTYAKEGFDMFIVAVGVSTTTSKRTIRLATKKNPDNGTNRGLVLGHLLGMSGFKNGGDLNLKDSIAEMNAASTSALNSKMSQISSSVDGEQMLALSEIAAIVDDPDDVFWLKAYWAAQA